MRQTHPDQAAGPKSQSAADSVSQIKRNSASSPLIDNRPEAVAQRRLQTLADNSPRVMQLHAAQQMADFHTSRAPIQLKVTKYRAGAWFSSFDPYTTFRTQKEATDYEKTLRPQNLKHRRARVPTLYTYTQTKPTNQLPFTKQGPHTVAHRIILRALVEAKTKEDVHDIFDKQVLTPADVKEVIFVDEAPPSGSFTTTMTERLNRYIKDYRRIYRKATDMFNTKDPDLIKLKHLTNRLLNMDPYAVYGWKTIRPASKKSLKAKGENVQNAKWENLYDAPPKKSIQNEDNLSSFVEARQNLFNQHF